VSAASYVGELAALGADLSDLWSSQSPSAAPDLIPTPVAGTPSASKSPHPDRSDPDRAEPGHFRMPRISLRCTDRRAFSSAASDRPGRGVAAASSGTAAGENIVYTLNDLTIAVPATIENLRVVELRPDSTA
jgi:hypothetical protein